VLAPRTAYVIEVRAIDLAPSLAFVVTLEVSRRDAPPAAEIDDFSQLAPKHRAFIDRWARIAATGDLGPERGEVTARDADAIEHAGNRLTRIFSGRCTLNPTSTGCLDVSFWSADDGSLWFIHAGGCIAYRSVLYGPY
jgi:hypothetical protein